LVGIVTRMKPSTEAMRVERIDEWARSGQSAAEFAEDKPFTTGNIDVGGVTVEGDRE